MLHATSGHQDTGSDRRLWLLVAFGALLLMLCAGLALGDVFEIYLNGAAL